MLEKDEKKAFRFNPTGNVLIFPVFLPPGHLTHTPFTARVSSTGQQEMRLRDGWASREIHSVKDGELLKNFKVGWLCGGQV